MLVTFFEFPKFDIRSFVGTISKRLLLSFDSAIGKYTELIFHASRKISTMHPLNILNSTWKFVYANRSDSTSFWNVTPRVGNRLSNCTRLSK